MNLYDELCTVLSALEDAGVAYALVGGLAVAVWGAARATKDIDLLVRKEDQAAAMAAVGKHGYTLAAFPFEFKDGTVLNRVNKVDGAGNVMTVDFIIVNKATESVWQSRVRKPLGQGEFWVVSREALIAMKALSARPQDIMDIQNLKEMDR